MFLVSVILHVTIFRPHYSINACKEHMFMQQIVPTIKLKWPACLSKNIDIQQDNCKTHINNNDADFQEAANSDGYHMKMVQQPANSPDCNANDLGLFTAIQSLQQRMKCKNADELIAAVHTSFQSMEPQTVNKVFLSLQCVLLEIMKVKGMNNFKQPHMKKDSLLRQGLLPHNLEVPEHLVRESIDYLIAEERTEGLEILMEEMGINVPQGEGGVFDLNN